MKTWFVDFEGWVEVSAENAEEAKEIVYELLEKPSVVDYNIRMDTDEVEDD